MPPLFSPSLFLSGPAAAATLDAHHGTYMTIHELYHTVEMRDPEDLRLVDRRWELGGTVGWNVSRSVEAKR
ncbi:hypothetical protein C8R45DRAFT_1102255 [Mycena sanguinolenta]|nr:hypothetical protein C8R45DRAFT_1102255 [Mycena sanguinolenta]